MHLNTGQMVYVNKLQPSKTSEADKLSGMVRSKLLLNSYGLYKVISSTNYSLIIYEKRVSNN